MSILTKTAGAAVLGIAILAAAAPASAQERSRTGRTADEIARGIREVAEAVGTVTDAVYQSVGGIRYMGRDRWVIDRCRAYGERYGRMRIQDLRRYSRSSWRVYGTIEMGGRFNDDRYGYRDRYAYRDRYGARSFTCTVRDDGRVKFKTKRLRY